MKSIVLKSFGLALWLTVLQVPFTFVVLTPLVRQYPEVWSRFNWEFFSGGFQTFSINLLSYGIDFAFILVAAVAYFGVCHLAARLISKREVR